ncbi:hypothetical protein DSO57_1028012 [Entomophthora muscae]|uniref:Uncharacterized protein n=1 Tax=Entomophthora muscae TaxID=34485 RepID=A0ACC2T1R4_9FUNG|nr:hypothetical protein DSO57_1028012 [Entomophthora muscae]
MPQRSNIFSTTIGLASFHMLNGLTVHPWTPVGCFKLFHGGALAKMSIFLCASVSISALLFLAGTSRRPSSVFLNKLSFTNVNFRDFATNSLASSLEFNFNFEVAVSTSFCKFVL